MNTTTLLAIIDANHIVIKRHQALFDTTMEKLHKVKNILSKQHCTLWVQVNYHFEISKRLIAENEVLLKKLKEI